MPGHVPGRRTSGPWCAEVYSTLSALRGKTRKPTNAPGGVSDWSCHNKKLGLVDRQHHARFDPHVGQLGTHDAAHPRRVRRARTCLWVGMRRRQLNQQLNQETVILQCRRAHPSLGHPRASMPGWAPKFLMPAITHYTATSCPACCVGQSDAGRSSRRGCRSHRPDSLATPVRTLPSPRARIPSWDPNDVMPAPPTAL